MRRYRGGCFCGAIKVTFETRHTPARLPIRSCTCEFCLKHRARSASDPAGRAAFRVNRRRLGRFHVDWTGTTVLVCGRCGVYVGTVMRGGAGYLATLNVNALEALAELPRAGARVDYSRETPARTRARRLARWTPATIRF